MSGLEFLPTILWPTSSKSVTLNASTFTDYASESVHVVQK
jgi:hypothetical protein